MYNILSKEAKELVKSTRRLSDYLALLNVARKHAGKEGQSISQ